MSIYAMVYFDCRGQVTAMEEFDASDDGAARRLAEGREWSGSYEIRDGSRTVYGHVGPRLIAGR
jgi:hypothetical protein